jgi:Berberine and berberine like
MPSRYRVGQVVDLQVRLEAGGEPGLAPAPLYRAATCINPAPPVLLRMGLGRSRTEESTRERTPDRRRAGVGGTEGGYVNFMSADDAARTPVNYGGTYERLRAVKTTYDPDNLFHLNQNVAPA